MKTKTEILMFYPYEYKQLQVYFQEMAEKGWKLTSMQGSWMFTSVTYEACTPQTIYYYTDYTAENGLSKYNSDKTEDYREFIEEYGYHYVTGFKGVLVFSSETPIPLEIRENTSDSKKQLRKATWYAAMGHFASIVVGVLYLCFFGLNNVSDILSSNIGVVCYLAFHVLLIVLVLSIVPPFIWLISGKHTVHVKKMKHRATILLFTFYLWLLTSIKSKGEVDSIIDLVFVVVLSILIFIALYNFLRNRKLRHTKRILACVLLIWVGGMFAYANQLRIKSETSDEAITLLPKEILHITSTQQPISKTFTSFVLCKQSTFYENGQLYDFTYIKDTPLKALATFHITREWGAKLIKQISGYKIYKRAHDYLILKDDIALELCKEAYYSIDVKTYNVIFEQIEEAM